MRTSSDIDSRAAPRVTIAMAVRNGAASVGRAVDSIRLQTTGDWELIVVDDGSRDESAAIVQARRDPRIRLLRNSASRGLAASLNLALDEARGDYFARIDADDVAFPERIERQARHLDAQGDTAIVGCSTLMFRSNGRPVGVIAVPPDHAAIVRHPSRGFPLLHPTWMARTAWLLGTRYDERFLKAQDFELLLRSIGQGRLANLEEVLLGYRYEAASLRKRLETRNYVVRALVKNRRRLGVPGVIFGTGLQAAKGLLDIAVAGGGLAGFRDRIKCEPATAGLMLSWQSLWQRLDRENESCAA